MVSKFSFLFGTFMWGRGSHFFSYSLILRRISEIWNCQQCCHSNKNGASTIAEFKIFMWNLLHENLLKPFQQKKETLDISRLSPTLNSSFISCLGTMILYCSMITVLVFYLFLALANFSHKRPSRLCMLQSLSLPLNSAKWAWLCSSKTLLTKETATSYHCNA